MRRRRRRRRMRLCCCVLLLLWSSLFICCLLGVSSLSTEPQNAFIEAVNSERVQLISWSQPTDQPIVRDEKFANSEVLDIHCYHEIIPLNLHNIFASTTFYLDLEDRYYEVYVGKNASYIYDLFERRKGTWKTVLYTNTPSISCSPFAACCIGIKAIKSYKIRLTVEAVDQWLCSVTLAGVLLFLFADGLSRTSAFHYLLGTLAGVVFSVMLIFFLLSRSLNQKLSVVALSVVAGGSLTVWFMRWIWYNLQMAIDTYREVVFIYLMITSLISFSVCYYKGPVTNTRLLDLLRWLLKAISVLVIQYGLRAVFAELSFFVANFVNLLV